MSQVEIGHRRGSPEPGMPRGRPDRSRPVGVVRGCRGGSALGGLVAALEGLRGRAQPG